MSEEIYLRVRIKITLAQETFKGPDHSGAPQVNYELNHPILITMEDGQPIWRQQRDREYRMDSEHLPGRGSIVMDGNGNFFLKDMAGKDVLTLNGFTTPASSQRGDAVYTYAVKQYAPTKDSNIEWRGKGVWEIVEDRSSKPETRFVTSDWSFNTSASTSLGILMAEGGTGTITLTSPTRVNHKFAYVGGGPSLDIGKVLKAIKLLKDLIWMQKTAKGLTAIGGSLSTEDMFSAGVIIKNTLRKGWNELTPNDFTGPCFWFDAGVGAFGHGRGLMFLYVGIGDWFNPLPTALIPMYGHIKAPLQLGVGACVGAISRG